jgi:hypothetical protein
MSLADPNFEDFRAQNHTLRGLALYNDGPESVSGGSEPIRMLNRTAHGPSCLGRPRDRVTVEQASADLDSIARRMRNQYGEKVNLTDAAFAPFADGDVRTAFLTLIGAAGVSFGSSSLNLLCCDLGVKVAGAPQVPYLWRPRHNHERKPCSRFLFCRGTFRALKRQQNPLPHVVASSTVFRLGAVSRHESFSL